MAIVSLKRILVADHVSNGGFSEYSVYRKEKRNFYACIKSTQEGWIGYYATVTGEMLTRNEKPLKVSGEDALQVMKDLYEASKIISLDVPDEYIDNLNKFRI